MCRGNRWGRRGIASVVCLVIVLSLLAGGAGAATLESDAAPTTHSVTHSDSSTIWDTRANVGSVEALEGALTGYQAGFDDDEEIEVLSRPEGASVYVDGEFVGETPWRDDGEYDDPIDIRVELDSGESKTYTDVTAPETIRADFEDDEDDEPERDTLSVDSDPAGATVLIDDREVGDTPWEDELPADESVTVTLEKPGYETVRETDVGAGDELVVELEASDQPLEIAAVDAPRFVDVSTTAIDIETTVENVGSAERTETLSLTLEGTEIDSQSVTLADGEHTTVTFTPDIEGEDGESLEYQLSLEAHDELGQVVFESSEDNEKDDDDPTTPDSLSVDAGDDRTVAVDSGDRLVLGATVSSDPPADDTLSVSWSQLEGPSVDIEDETTVAPAFSVPELAEPATVTFEVTATLGEREATDTVTLTLEPIDGGTEDEGEDTSSGESDGTDGDTEGGESGGDGTNDDDRDDEPSGDATEVGETVDSDGDDPVESAVRGDIEFGSSPLVTARLGFVLALVTGMVAHRQLLTRE